MTNFEIGTSLQNDLEILQQLQKHQYQSYLLMNQLRQQQCTRSQTQPQQQTNPSYNRQAPLPTLNDLYYSSSRSTPLTTAPAVPLPQAPCISLQRRDSVKSDGSHSSNDVSASRYKTELCRPFEETGHCRYGSKCQFAHGSQELRSLNRHPRYKTEFCRTFHTTGFCSYGQRCNFIHNEEERRPPQSPTNTTTTSTVSRPQALNLNGHLPLRQNLSAGSTGSSPAGSVYGDASPVHSPSYLSSEDNFSMRLSPTPSYSSDNSFPSPANAFDDFHENTLLSSPLDLGLPFSFMSKLSI